MKTRKPRLGWLALGLVLAAPGVRALEPPRFADESASAGIQHRYEGGWEFFVGGGVATFDCDGDGRPDVYLAGGKAPAKLYRNTSRTGGRLSFSLVAASATGVGQVTGAYPLDIDGDGAIDLVVLRVGENILFRGLGGCRFERANEAWTFAGGDAWTTAFTARWDPGRRWPTLVFGNYVDRTKPGSPWGTCHDNVLVRPGPDRGFAPPEALAPGYCALSALFSDWNRDGTADLRLSNDRQYYRGGQEQLWRIPASGPPSRYTPAEGWRKLVIWGMGIATHDVDGDGYPDYLLTSMGDNKLRILTEGADRPSYGSLASQRDRDQ